MDRSWLVKQHISRNMHLYTKVIKKDNDEILFKCLFPINTSLFVFWSFCFVLFSSFALYTRTSLRDVAARIKTWASTTKKTDRWCVNIVSFVSSHIINNSVLSHKRFQFPNVKQYYEGKCIVTLLSYYSIHVKSLDNWSPK